ncbi:MAG TPA: sugar phosphate isomerase/epimerase [Gemmatimonadaceae bacterium]|nr:sugar phosphate isomerase/epimerase [Gemmatimonadaceae bacterium]
MSGASSGTPRGAAMSRRELLRLLGAAAALPVTSALAGFGAPRGAIAPLGIQLYTVRSALARDAAATLAALAGIGYREVELAGMHGLSARDFRALLDRNGLAAPSSHVGLDALGAAHRARTFDDAATLGNRWLVCPWLDPKERTADGYRRAAAALNDAAAAARGHGIRIAYHNHDFEHAPLADAGGRTGYDLLLAECDPSLVAMEMDLYWMVKGGRDPVAYFERFPGRFPLVHAKDMARDGTMVDVGAGTIDFARILRHAGQAGIRHWFVEHDDPASPLASARASYEYLTKLRGG